MENFKHFFAHQANRSQAVAKKTIGPQLDFFNEQLVEQITKGYKTEFDPGEYMQSFVITCVNHDV